MKNILFKIIVALVVTAILFSCKKSDPPAGKDYSPSIKDKTWWGMVSYGTTPEYYSVHFKTDNSLIWSEFSGDYSGKWLLNGNEMTITFDGKSTEIKASISDDDHLVNIKDNTTASEVKSGELISNPNIALDNTSWSGIIDYPAVRPFYFNFKPGSTMTVNNAPLPIQFYNYIRLPESPTIRVNTIFFGIIIAEGQMKGSMYTATGIWHATK